MSAAPCRVWTGRSSRWQRRLDQCACSWRLSTHVATVVQADRAALTNGSFLGITSVTEPDGSQRAVEVHVFPESMRGTGEGSHEWDVPSANGAAAG